MYESLVKDLVPLQKERNGRKIFISYYPPFIHPIHVGILFFLNEPSQPLPSEPQGSDKMAHNEAVVNATEILLNKLYLLFLVYNIRPSYVHDGGVVISALHVTHRRPRQGRERKTNNIGMSNNTIDDGDRCFRNGKWRICLLKPICWEHRGG